MTWSRDAWAEVAWSEIPDAGTRGSYVQVWNAEFGRIFLYELTAYKRGSGSWDSPWGYEAWGREPAGALISGEAIFRFSDMGYITLPTDSPANTNYDGSVQAGLKLTRSLPATPESDRRVNLELGSFDLANVDGVLDSVVAGYSVDGRRVRVLLGLTSYRYGDFVPVFTGRMIQWSNSGDDVTVEVRDEGYRLDKPMQTDIYGGTGAYDGGSDVTGKPRPLAFGKVLNISPVLIEASTLTYQFHSRIAQAVDAVYDRGAALTADLDYATYALLAAATITAGHYATCLAKGLIRLGSTPSGLVTADVRGDAQGGYTDVTATIAKRVVKDFGGLSDTDLDLASWDNLATAQPGTIGWYQDTTAINVSAAIGAVLGGCAAWWGPTPAGLLTCGQIIAPSSASYVIAIAESEIVDFQILPPLGGTFPPRFRQRVGYQKLWTTQQDTDLAGAVTAARRSYLAQDTRVAASTDISVQTAYLLAVDPDPLVSLFNNQSDAAALATSLLTLYKTFRQTARITMGLGGQGARLGAAVLVTHHRLNGGSPTPMLVMDITIDADAREYELVCWG
jgi:hypothetical protein